MSRHRYAQDSVCLKDVLRGLGEIFSEDKVDVDEVKSLLRAYKSNPKDWRKYCTWIQPGNIDFLFHFRVDYSSESLMKQVHKEPAGFGQRQV